MAWRLAMGLDDNDGLGTGTLGSFEFSQKVVTRHQCSSGPGSGIPTATGSCSRCLEHCLWLTRFVIVPTSYALDSIEKWKTGLECQSEIFRPFTLTVNRNIPILRPTSH